MKRVVFFWLSISFLVSSNPTGAQDGDAYTCDGGEHDIVAAAQIAFDADDLSNAQALLDKAETLCISNLTQYREVVQLQDRVRLKIEKAEQDTFIETSEPGMVDLGDYSLFMRCVGEGSPTVILENGLGAPSIPVWDEVVTGLESIIRVCFYERLGIGYSDSVPAGIVRTTQDQVDDLVNLLKMTDSEGPFILVGHSIAGLNLLLFTDQHPDLVAGLVLVDASHPEQFERFATVDSPNFLNPEPGQGASIEQLDLLASAEQVGEVPHDLGDIPLVVLTAGENIDPEISSPPEFAAIWQELQEDHAARSTNSQHIIVEGAPHFIMQTDPEAVVEAIEWVLAEIQENSVETK